MLWRSSALPSVSPALTHASANCVAESVEISFGCVSSNLPSFGRQPIDCVTQLLRLENLGRFQQSSFPLPQKLEKPLFLISSSLLDQVTCVLVALLFLS
jgi:hypothetical protein